MKSRVHPNQRVTIDEACENLANEGLRTLVIAQKQLDEKEFEGWQENYRQAKADMNNREKAMNRCLEELETDMELLGITGVEGKGILDVNFVIDKLQDDVAIIIENLRSAGIQVWMLTGDKVETATCIALSAGFKSRSQEFFYIRD